MGFAAPAIEEWTEWDLNPRLPPCEGGDLPLIYRPDLGLGHRRRAYRFRPLAAHRFPIRVDVGPRAKALISRLLWPRPHPLWRSDCTTPAPNGRLRSRPSCPAS